VSGVVAVVPDLFFAAKLQATARAAGTELALVAAGAALERCAASPPVRVLLDLHAPGVIALARALKADPRTESLRLTGFYSHVDGALRAEAIAAGVDDVLPRSAFVNRLPELLGGSPESSS
jgi:CheY-like chemotaxis protein